MIKKNTLIKTDSSENWSKAKNFIPKDKEIIIYNDIEKGIKIGDGITKVNDLPFISYEIYNVEEDTLIIDQFNYLNSEGE